ncbi:hypothetical protein GCM10010211_03180 [Streptomyces albospinus]|uniref:Uncharacterized protein n=1 Tax=Streptomyces albospinus TaxID=285515 RepID=A0ABQ2UP78_9ACTN|nr:hypothetical protein [Streptomyces albospinus]GGU43168.1 hypothetical protein GCM10010211_03180 [Streptomyces albospinus]
MHERVRRIELPDGTEVWARVSGLDAAGTLGWYGPSSVSCRRRWRPPSGR